MNEPRLWALWSGVLDLVSKTRAHALWRESLRFGADVLYVRRQKNYVKIISTRAILLRHSGS
jgi:hypothetical protein